MGGGNGSKGSDELNLVNRKSNFGYPIVSNGDHYSGADTRSRHTTRIRCSENHMDSGHLTVEYALLYRRGIPRLERCLLIGGLSSRALIRVILSNGEAREAERFGINKRIRK